MAVEVTLTLANNNKLLNNISQIALPPQTPGQRPTIISDVLLDYPPQYVPPEGKKSLSATTLQERERTPCPHTLSERVRTPCFLSPQEGERTPCFHTQEEGVKTPCSHTPQEGVQTPCVQSHIVFIQDQVQNKENLKVGSRLKSFLPVWKNVGAHHSIQNLIAEGYKLPFRERPKLSRTPCITSGFADLNKQNALSTAIQDLILKGAIDIVQKPDSLGFYSHLFLVPKPGNRWRPVIDLSCLNKFLAISKFKMETPESIRASLRKKEWVTSIDLTDAYLHIPIHPQSQKYLRFHHKGVSYQFTSLPFGLATAPLTFTNVKGGQAFSLTTGNTHSSIPGRLADSRPLQGGVPQADTKVVKPNPGFGFCSELQEVRTGTFLEVRFSGLPFFTRYGACQAHARQVVEASRYVPSPLVKVCYQCKNSYVHHWITCINGEDSQTGQDAYETFSMASQDSLEISDASGYSNPLESEDDTTRGMVVRPQIVIQGEFLKAVFLALQFFKTTCKNNRVLIASDNTSVVSYINKQDGTRSAELCALMWRILTWCNLNNVTLRARHIPGSLNVIADGLTRRNKIQSTEWSLSPQVFKQISKIWESPQVDLFATRLNTKLPLYVSPIPDPQAWAVDALNIPWENLVAYTFPPTALLPKVLQKLQSQMCRLLLITPGWPSKPWFWDLVEMSLDVP